MIFLWSLLALNVASEVVGQTLVDGTSNCRTCEIEVADQLILGSPGDSVSVSGLPRVTLGIDNRIYVTATGLSEPGVLMYDARGGFAGVLGRAGGGPGELHRVHFIGATEHGDIVVQDQRSVHVFSKDRLFLRTLTGIPRTLVNLHVVGDSLLATVPNARSPMAPERAIQLYSLRTGQSMGGTGPIGDLAPSGQPAVVAMSRSGRELLWSVEPPNMLDLWNVQGERVRGFVWAEDWLSHVDARYADVSADQGYVLHDVWEDTSRGLIWIISVVPDPGYVDPMAGVTQGPMPGYFDPSALNARNNTIVSVLDINQGAILAHLQLERNAYQFLSDGRLVFMGESTNGYQWLELVTLRFSGYVPEVSGIRNE